jgi:hypothetical protein
MCILWYVQSKWGKVFDWDEENRDHMRRPGIEPEEAEAAEKSRYRTRGK